MYISPIELVNDLLQLHLHQSSALYDQRADEIQAPTGTRSNFFASADYKMMRKYAYLTRLIQGMGNSYPSTVIKLEKAGKGHPEAHRIRSAAYRALLFAVMGDKDHTLQHMDCIWQLVKTDPKGLIFAIDGFLANGVNFSKSSMSNAMVDIEVNQATMPLHVCTSLFANHTVGKYDTMPSFLGSESRKQAHNIYAHVFAGKWSAEATAASKAIRVVKKHSRKASKHLALLYANHAIKDGTTDPVPQTSEGQAFIRRLIEEGGMMEGMVSMLIAQGLRNIKETHLREEGNPNDLKAVRRYLDFIREFSNKIEMDNAIISSVGQLIQDIRFPSEPTILKHLHAFLTTVIDGSTEKTGCWWSILNRKESLIDYKGLSKNKNSVLRSAIDIICLRASVIPTWVARSALLNFYSQKSVNLLLHGNPDRENVLKKLYDTVGDRELLGRMENGTKRAVLVDDLGI